MESLEGIIPDQIDVGPPPIQNNIGLDFNKIDVLFIKL